MRPDRDDRDIDYIERVSEVFDMEMERDRELDERRREDWRPEDEAPVPSES